MVDPDMGAWYYAYDDAGNLLSQTDAKVQTIAFEYDVLNRLKAKKLGVGGPTLASYAYDVTTSGNKGIGRRTSMKAYDPPGVLNNVATWKYDILGRAIEETRTVAGNNYKFTFGYTQGDVPVSITYPGGRNNQAGETVTTQYYWVTGQPKSMSGDSIYVSSAAYAHQSGAMTNLTQPGGVVTTYGYDSAYRLGSILTKDGGTTRLNFTYAYDVVGNITMIKEPSGSLGVQEQHFAYDSLNRLVSAYTVGGSAGTYNEDYDFDAIGNLTDMDGVAMTYQSSKPHAVTHLGGVEKFRYDANGNMYWRVDEDNRTWDLAWTAENMLRQATVIAGSNTGDTVRMVYDADGQMIRRMENAGQASEADSVFLGKLYEDDLKVNLVTKHYFFNGQIVAQKDNAEVTFVLTDHLGSTAMTLYTSGTTKGQQRYDPWGDSRWSSNYSHMGYRYTSQRWDGKMKLLDYNARYYDPEIGKFISADTIVPGDNKTQALNRYSYSFNRPIISTDPNGHDPVLEGEITKEEAQELIDGLQEAQDLLDEVLSDLTFGFSDFLEGLLKDLGVSIPQGASAAGLIQLLAANITPTAVGGAAYSAQMTTLFLGGSTTTAAAAGFLAPVFSVLLVAILAGGLTTHAILTTSITIAKNQFKEIENDLKGVVSKDNTETIAITIDSRGLNHKFKFQGYDGSSNKTTTRRSTLGWSPLQIAGFSASESIISAWSEII
jgi:RHS repeat-associated protein